MKKINFIRLLVLMLVLMTGINSVWANSDHTFSGGWLYFDNNSIKEKDGTTVSYWVVSGGTAYFNIYGGTGTGAGYNCGSEDLEHLDDKYYRIKFPTGKCDTWQLVRGSNSNCETRWNWTYAGDAANFNNGKNYFYCNNGNYYYTYAAYNAILYWDNRTAGWNNKTLELMIGRSSSDGAQSTYSNTYTLTQVTNAPGIYYYSLGWFADYTEYDFIAVDSHWGSSDTQAPNARKSSATYRTNVRKEGLEGHHWYSYTSGTTNDQALPKTDMSSYSEMDRTITIKEAYNSTGVGDYTEITCGGETFGTISASGYKFDSWTTCAGSSSANLTKESTTTFSADADFGYTSTVTLTAGATKAGKAFVGWYRSNGTLISANTSTTITVTGDETVYAYYKDEETHDVTVSYMCSSSSIKDGVTESAVGVTTTRSVTAPDIDHYEFDSWTNGSGVTVSSTTAKTITINSVHGSDLSYTLTANYKRLTRFYFDNTGSWSNVYAYMWEQGSDPLNKNGEWEANPITSQTKTIACGTRHYYEYDASAHPWDRIIFHNGESGSSEKKTADLTVGSSLHADELFVYGDDWYDLTDHNVSVATEASYKGTVSGGGTAKSYGCSVEITATPKPGYRFDSWVVTSGTAEIADASSATTTVTASTDATITARFNQNKIIYFDNTMSRWDDSNGIWVYLFSNTYGVWYDDNVNGGVHPGENRLEYGRMTRIGTSNIYYYEYNTSSTIAAVAFTKADQHNNTAFYQTSAAWVTSFPTCLPCYMASERYMSKNSTGYHSYGYWKRWGNTDSGFSLWIDEGNSTWVEHHFSNNDPSSNVYTTSVTFSSANTVYGYNVARCFGGSKLRRADYSGNIQDSDSDWPRELGESSYDGGLRTSSAGTYNFTLSLATDHITMTVEYPLSVGDYRVRLVNDVQNHPSGRVIRARSETRTDTVSFFIDHTKTNILYVDTCTNTGNPPRWNRITDVPAATLTLSASPYNTTTGIYKFGITRTKHKDVSLVLLDDPVYDGKYYIRTDVADGKWTSYMSAADNIMQYSDYSLTTSPAYDYYYTKWAAAGKNMHFVIANDYSPCITDTLMGDATYLNGSDALPANANVRFSWNSATNETSRAFISGSSNINDRFLVLEGDSKMFDEDGNALTGENRYHRVNEDETITYLTTDNDVVFEDDHNWIYETTVKAQPNAKIKLTAEYNGHIQYFYGSEGNSPADSVLLIGGSGTDKYKMRVVYDFKTNRLIKAFLPEKTINSGLEINADLMIIREHQEEALQINFSGGSLSEVKTVYGAMKFNKWTVNGKEKGSGHASTGASQYERDLFWISFPFNVKLKDAFGFGTYGTHWIIERYDGKTRAQNGFWADSPSNWKFITPYQRDSGWVLNANEGYILALDLDEMTESSSIWDNDVEDVYVYFPSNGNVGNIQSTTADVTIDQTDYQCTIGPRFEGGDDRRIKDSYWHCIGVPSYANTTQTYSSSDIPAELNTETWEPESTLYFYEWNSTSNTLSIHTSAGYDFKAMHSYMVQYAAGTLLWTSVTNTVPASVAARLNETHDRNYSLALMRESEEEDHTLLRLTDDASVTNRFEFNYDLSKEYNAGHGNIWTVTADTVEVAGNSMPKPVQTTIVPVGVKVVANGEYTLAMPEGTNGEDVYLIDNAYGTRTNLGLMPYTVTLTAGTYDSRFVLELCPVQDAPTNLQEMENGEWKMENDDVRKVFVGGRLYILRDGKVYDAAGQRIE